MCSKLGKIKTIYCRNFVTYEQCTFEPNEYLNIIIGPNGTGKSTLVAAIVLGFGGDANLLSRASNIAEYIKNGKDSACIEITIYAGSGETETQTYSRIINKDLTSEYKIDSKIVSRLKFLKAIAAYKIQINNLCQFLPQDRVQDFAKMNPQELFENTIKSVCSTDILNRFGELVELQKNIQQKTKDVHQTAKKVAEYTKRLEELKKILDRYSLRMGFVKQIELCNMKKTWLAVDALKEKIKQKEKDREQAMHLLKNAEREYNKVKSQYEKLKDSRNQIVTEIEMKKLEEHRHLKSLKNTISAKEKLKSDIQREKSIFENSKSQVVELKAEIEQEQASLLDYTTDLKTTEEKFASVEANKERIAEMNGKLNKLKGEIAMHIQKRSNINKKLEDEYIVEMQVLKNRIERLKNVTQLKMEFIKGTYPHLYTAMEWVTNNQHRFSGTVYNPMLLELNVINTEHSKYFENVIAIRDLLAFTCEKKADLSLISEELCIKRKLGISVVYSQAADHVKYMPPQPIENLRQYGFIAYLIDLIKGPPAILNYLCSMYGLHKVPIGGEMVRQHTDSIPLNIRHYFGANTKYTVSISKYSNESSLMQSNIKNNNLLHSRDEQALKIQEDRLAELVRNADILRNERTASEAKIDELQFQFKTVNHEKKSIEQSAIHISQLKNRIVTVNAKINRLLSKVESMSSLKEKFENTAKGLVGRLVRLQKEEIEALALYKDALVVREFAVVRLLVFDRENDALTNQIETLTHDKEQKQEMVSNINRSIEQEKRNVEMKYKSAMQVSNNCTPDSRNFPSKKLYMEMPNTVEELDDRINEFKARLDCMENIDGNIVEEYNTKSSEVITLRQQLESNEETNSANKNQLSDLYQSWIPDINHVIDVINRHFSAYMKSLACVGEVLLDFTDEHDFNSYGIKIMVQFRKNAQLQQLSRQVQSGGERAVAIALYTLSMQQISRVPFRCVDEINQGMDPTNERRVFGMLVDETTKENQSQYFFVTPKLLSNLPYNSRMTVHIIYNGMNVLV